MANQAGESWQRRTVPSDFMTGMGVSGYRREEEEEEEEERPPPLKFDYPSAGD